MIFACLANRPAVPAIVTLGPPAVQDAAIWLPVERCFLAAGTTGFVRTYRVVQPEIGSGNQVASHLDIIVFQENDLAPECIAAREPVNLLNEGFTRPVGRMGFSCKDNLHRTFRIVQDAPQVFGVAEDQRGALISGEAPCETNNEGVAIQHVFKLGHLDGTFAQAQVVTLQIATGIIDQRLLPLQVCLPQLLVRNLCDCIPEIGFIHVIFPVVTQVAFEERAHLGCNPGRCMDAIRDIINRYLVSIYPWPQELPHVPRDCSM